MFSSKVNLLLKFGNEDSACAKDNDRCFVDGTYSWHKENHKGQTHLSTCCAASPMLNNAPGDMRTKLQRIVLIASSDLQCTYRISVDLSCLRAWSKCYHTANPQMLARTQIVISNPKNSKGLSPENTSGFLRIRLADSRPLADEPLPCWNCCIDCITLAADDAAVVAARVNSTTWSRNACWSIPFAEWIITKQSTFKCFLHVPRPKWLLLFSILLIAFHLLRHSSMCSKATSKITMTPHTSRVHSCPTLFNTTINARNFHLQGYLRVNNQPVANTTNVTVRDTSMSTNCSMKSDTLKPHWYTTPTASKSCCTEVWKLAPSQATPEIELNHPSTKCFCSFMSASLTHSFPAANCSTANCPETSSTPEKYTALPEVANIACPLTACMKLRLSFADSSVKFDLKSQLQFASMEALVSSYWIEISSWNLPSEMYIATSEVHEIGLKMICPNPTTKLASCRNTIWNIENESPRAMASVWCSQDWVLSFCSSLKGPNEITGAPVPCQTWKALFCTTT